MTRPKSCWTWPSRWRWAGDCLADIALLRAEPGVYGRVASDPTVSRTIDALAADVGAALTAIDTARAAARAQVWGLAGDHAPDHGTDADQPLIVDVDPTLVGAHSEKEQARPTFKRGFGFHPLCVFVDHGALGTGEPLAIMLRPGNAGSNTAADHIAVVKQALRLRQPAWRDVQPALPRRRCLAGGESMSPADAGRPLRGRSAARRGQGHR